MLEILKISPKGIKAIPKIEENCWINTIQPTDEEIEKLKKKDKRKSFWLFWLLWRKDREKGG